MGITTTIEWATDSWHPITGCAPVSPGCANCWAKRLLTKRYRSSYLAGDAFKLRFYSNKFTYMNSPVNWRVRTPPRRIFACGMTDIFHPDIPAEWLEKVFGVVKNCPGHVFIFLTKRPERIEPRLLSAVGLAPDAPPANMWLGVSVESAGTYYRVGELARRWSGHRFVCYEPLLGDLLPDDETSEWAIIGGESGDNARPFPLGTAHLLVAYYHDRGVPPFVKQMGTVYGRENRMDYKGTVIDRFPEGLRVRMFPEAMLKGLVPEEKPRPKEWF